MRKWSLFAFVVAVVVTLSIPATNIMLFNWLSGVWPPLRFMRAVGLMTGAHESLITTQACSLGLFDAIHSRNSKTSASSWWQQSVCLATASNLSVEIGIQEGATRSLLRALVTIGLLHRVGSESEESYCNTATTEAYFVVNTSSSNYLCGMGISGNHPHVLAHLGNLREAFRLDKEVTASETFLDTLSFPSSEADADMWKVFATATSTFSSRLGLKVADVVSNLIGDGSVRAVIDVGCGSGEYLRATMKTIGPVASKYVYADLEPVLKETKTLHEKSLLPDAVEYLPVSIFSNELFTFVRSTGATQIVMINSVLQHVNDSAALSVAEKLGSAMRHGGCQSTCGYLLITELHRLPAGSSFVSRVLHEPLPMIDIFDVVLQAFSGSGRIRSAADYIAIGSAAGRLVGHHSLFPVPASVFVFEIL